MQAIYLKPYNIVISCHVNFSKSFVNYEKIEKLALQGQKSYFPFHNIYIRIALSDIEGSLESLNKKLDWIINRLNYLEAVLTESQQYPEVVDFLQKLKLGTALYGEPLKTLNRIISARQLIESTSQKDEINKIILNYIALKGPKNISELTREIRRQRGKASRTTIRKRVKQLVNSKALVKKEKRYYLP